MPAAIEGIFARPTPAQLRKRENTKRTQSERAASLTLPLFCLVSRMSFFFFVRFVFPPGQRPSLRGRGLSGAAPGPEAFVVNRAF